MSELGWKPSRVDGPGPEKWGSIGQVLLAGKEGFGAEKSTPSPANDVTVKLMIATAHRIWRRDAVDLPLIPIRSSPVQSLRVSAARVPVPTLGEVTVPRSPLFILPAFSIDSFHMGHQVRQFVRECRRNYVPVLRLARKKKKKSWERGRLRVTLQPHRFNFLRLASFHNKACHLHGIPDLPQTLG